MTHVNSFLCPIGLVLLFASCAQEPAVESVESPQAAQPATAPEWTGDPLSAEPAPGVDRFPCSAISQADIENLLNNPLEPASFAVEDAHDDGAAFQAESCSWLSFAEGSNEITIRVSQASHFPDATVLCPEPSQPQIETLIPEDEGTVERPSWQSVPNLGNRAWWIYEDPPGIGNLVVCANEARIAIEVSIGNGDGALALNAGRSLVEKVVDSLQ